MTKKKLLIFTQCVIYGGCDRLMQSIYNNTYITNEFDITYAYSYSSGYKKQLNLDLINKKNLELKLLPLILLTNGTLFYNINKLIENNYLKKIIKLPFHIIYKLGIYSIWNYIYLFIFFIKNKSHIVHINNGGYPAAEGCNQFTILLTIFPKTKIIYQVNNTAKKIDYFSFSDYLVNHRVNKFLTHSYVNKKSLIKRGFDENKIHSFPSYFNDTFSTLNDKSPDTFKNNFINIVNVGLLTKHKGQINLLKAILKIKNNNFDVFKQIRLFLIGDGEDENKLLKYVIENKIRDSIFFLGRRQDYYLYIKYCDIFIISSIESEDLPLVLLSSMQYGKPIISTSIAGISELLKNNFDSILINPDLDKIVDNLYYSIIELVKDENKRKYLSINVKKNYEENLTQKNYSMNILNLYFN